MPVALIVVNDSALDAAETALNKHRVAYQSFEVDQGAIRSEAKPGEPPTPAWCEQMIVWSEGRTLAEVENQLLACLRNHHGSIAEMARQMDANPSTLGSRMKKAGKE